jgi:hypothetical protein
MLAKSNSPLVSTKFYCLGSTPVAEPDLIVVDRSDRAASIVHQARGRVIAVLKPKIMAYFMKSNQFEPAIELCSAYSHLKSKGRNHGCFAWPKPQAEYAPFSLTVVLDDADILVG